jgi:hypothetical protein
LRLDDAFTSGKKQAPERPRGATMRCCLPLLLSLLLLSLLFLSLLLLSLLFLSLLLLSLLFLSLLLLSLLLRPLVLSLWLAWAVVIHYFVP